MIIRPYWGLSQTVQNYYTRPGICLHQPNVRQVWLTKRSIPTRCFMLDLQYQKDAWWFTISQNSQRSCRCRKKHCFTHKWQNWPFMKKRPLETWDMGRKLTQPVPSKKQGSRRKGFHYMIHPKVRQLLRSSELYRSVMLTIKSITLLAKFHAICPMF